MIDRLVYIIDDDPQLRESMRVLLATAGICCEQFGSAEEFRDRHDALEQSLEQSFILLDLKLPGLSGLDLWDQLQKRPVPPVVVMITGHGDVQLAVKALRSGVFHFLEKPFDPETFLTIAHEALEHAAVVADRAARSNDVQQRFNELSEREQDVLKLLVKGLPNKLIAYNLGISIRTVEHHRAAVMTKTGASSLSHLVRMAINLERDRDQLELSPSRDDV